LTSVNPELARGTVFEPKPVKKKAGFKNDTRRLPRMT